MNKYSDEKNAQIIVALLKEHGIKKVVVSPGATNIPIAGSLQYDPFFELISAPDERSAAYIACGIAQETNAPVAISCTGATSSRNYLPGLTEAYYRKLPILAITSFNGTYEIGNLIAQNIDRRVIQNDVAKFSADLPVVKDDKDFWYVELQVNRAILAMLKDGGGPAHLNVTTNYKGSFTTSSLPKVKKVDLVQLRDEFPRIPKEFKVAIALGSHRNFSTTEIKAIDKFCMLNNGIVLCDHTSNYYGEYRIQASLMTRVINSNHVEYTKYKPDLIIHIGEVSGDYPTLEFLTSSNAIVWRVSEDGEIRDTFKKISKIFHMDIISFFDSIGNNDTINHYKEDIELKRKNLMKLIPEVPFSNLWIAEHTVDLIPQNSNIHFGILNSLRNWNWFSLPKDVKSYSNVGGFGIDGVLSSAIGSSIASPNKLNFIVIGDLAFFYDMNVLGNRYLANNVRILLINNGTGTEFKNYDHQGAVFGKEADKLISAGGHYINRFGEYNESPAASWAKALGFKYISCSTKEEYLSSLPVFVDQKCDVPILVECFTTSEDESIAFKSVSIIDQQLNAKAKAKQVAKDILSPETKNMLKKVLRK